MYSQRYGTPPIVHATGGLVDSVVDCTPQSLAAGTATGFKFFAPKPEALKSAIARCVAAYRDPAVWRRCSETGWRVTSGGTPRRESTPRFMRDSCRVSATLVASLHDDRVTSLKRSRRAEVRCNAGGGCQTDADVLEHVGRLRCRPGTCGAAQLYELAGRAAKRKPRMDMRRLPGAGRQSLWPSAVDQRFATPHSQDVNPQPYAASARCWARAAIVAAPFPQAIRQHGALD